MAWRIGIDIGATLTDVALIHDAKALTRGSCKRGDITMPDASGDDRRQCRRRT